MLAAQGLFYWKESIMARKQTQMKIGSEVKNAPAVSKTITPVRNSAIPKIPAKKEITQDLIAERAYFISISGQGSSEMENWLRAERELRNA
jgi:hypothetical protein